MATKVSKAEQDLIDLGLLSPPAPKPPEGGTTSGGTTNGEAADGAELAARIGVGPWRCASCQHTWTGHGQVKSCPKCRGRKLERPEPRNPLGHTEGALGVRRSAAAGEQRGRGGERERGSNGVPHGDPSAWRDVLLSGDGRVAWHCQNCGHNWTANALERRCPECSNAKILGDPTGSAAPAGGQEDCQPGGQNGRQKPAGRDTKPAGRDTKPAKGETPAAAKVEGPMELCEVARLVPSGTNPRQDFDPQRLRQLAASIKAVGVLEPLLVRKLEAGRREILAGERRWRAAKLAGLDNVPVRVLDVTDEEAAEIQIRENLDRDDLNPIEQARSYQLALDRCGWTQAQCGARFGCSQEQVSNTLRLLKLPEVWQRRLITREISPTHARELLAWADVPAVLTRAEKITEIGSAADFRHEVLDAVRQASRPMVFSEWGNHGCKFRPTPAQKAQLDIRDVPHNYCGKERRAFNVKLWNELNSAAKKRIEQKKQKPQSARGAANQRVDTENAARRFGHKLWAHKQAWLYARLAGTTEALPIDLVWRSLLVLAHRETSLGIDEVLGIKQWSATELVAQAVSRLSPAQVESVARRVLARELGTDLGDYDAALPAEWLAALARAAGVDLAKQWTPTEEFVGLYESQPERLQELVHEHFGVVGRDAVVRNRWAAATIVAEWPKRFVPRELLDVDQDGKFSGAKKPGKKPGKRRAD